MYTWGIVGQSLVRVSHAINLIWYHKGLPELFDALS